MFAHGIADQSGAPLFKCECPCTRKLTVRCANVYYAIRFPIFPPQVRGIQPVWGKSETSPEFAKSFSWIRLPVALDAACSLRASRKWDRSPRRSARAFSETSTPRILARPTASRCGRQLKDQTPDVSDWREDLLKIPGGELTKAELSSIL